MLAQATPAIDPSLWSQFGPFGICLAVLLAVIVWLLRERTADKKTISEGELRERALYDRIIVAHEHLIPVLERTARVLERVEASL